MHDDVSIRSEERVRGSSLAGKQRNMARGFETLEAMRQFRCFLLPVARDLSSSFTVDSPNFLDRSGLVFVCRVKFAS